MIDVAAIIISIATGLVANGVFELVKAVRRKSSNTHSKKGLNYYPFWEGMSDSASAILKKTNFKMHTFCSKAAKSIFFQSLTQALHSVGKWLASAVPVDYAIFPRQLLFSPTSKKNA